MITRSQVTRPPVTRLRVAGISGLVLVVSAAVWALGGPKQGTWGGPEQGQTGPHGPIKCCDARIPVQSLPGSDTAQHVITQPGSYYLTAPVIGAPGRNAIEITAGSVTLDLNGFDLVGGPDSLSGVRVTDAHAQIVVRNGSARQWGLPAIDLAFASDSHAENLRASESGTGILIGNGALVHNCTAVSNTGSGIAAGQSSSVTRCIVRFNGGNGVYVLESSRIEGCVAEANEGNGYYLDGDGCSIHGSIAVANAVSGVASIYGGLVRACTSQHNRRYGIWSIAPLRVENCTAERNDQGGIFVTDGSTVSACTARENNGPGILAASHCRVERNDCGHHRNEGSGIGILITGSNTRVDGNHLSDNRVGLSVSQPGNFIVRNSASGNQTGYVLTGEQTAGPIIGGGGTIATENPWANFDF